MTNKSDENNSKTIAFIKAITVSVLGAMLCLTVIRVAEIRSAPSDMELANLLHTKDLANELLELTKLVKALHDQ